MRKDRLLILADVIENQIHYPSNNKPTIFFARLETLRKKDDLVGFNMTNWLVETDCGTCTCIAGWACYIFADEVSINANNILIEDAAAEILDLNTNEADWLFMGEFTYYNRERITPKQAAIAIRKLAAGDTNNLGIIDYTIDSIE